MADADAGAEPAVPDKKYANSPSSPAAGGHHASRAFMTQVVGPDTGRGKAQPTPRKALGGLLQTETQAGPRISEHFNELQNLAETLDDRVKALLRERKNDFFLAYKTHMYDVREQFKTLKAKADHEETKTRKDLKIQKLEMELDWFMQEALRLDELCRGYKTEVDKMKVKADLLDEDRKYLEDQIKGAKRQNKVLRAAVERASSSAFSALMMSKKREGAKGKLAPIEQGDAFLTSVGRPHSEMRQYPEGGALGQIVGSENRSASCKPELLSGTATGTELVLRGGSKMSAGGYPMPSANHAILGNDAEQRYVDAIRHLKEQIERERCNVRILKATRSNSYTRKSELEEFFLQCIDEARKDLLRRRHLLMNRDKSREEKVLEVLLSSEDVLVYLYEKLFPHRTGMAKNFIQGDQMPGPPGTIEPFKPL